jgi:hypothetical protein
MEQGQTSGVAIDERPDPLEGATDDRSGGHALIPGMLAFTLALIGMDAFFDRSMPEPSGVIGLTDAVAAAFLRPFEAVMGPGAGWLTAAAAAGAYTAAALVALWALRRAELPDSPA